MGSELQKILTSRMNRAFSAIFVSGLLLASSNACSSTSADLHDRPSVTLSISPASATPAGDVLVTVCAAAKRVQVAALQWTFRYDDDLISPVSFAVGPKALAAKKTISCASQKNETRCVLWGNNTKSIPDGDIAEARFRLRAGPQIPKTVITLDRSVGASVQGNSLAVVPAFSTVEIANPASAGPGSRHSKDTNNEHSKEVKTAEAVRRL